MEEETLDSQREVTVWVRAPKAKEAAARTTTQHDDQAKEGIAQPPALPAHLHHGFPAAARSSFATVRFCFRYSAPWLTSTPGHDRGVLVIPVKDSLSLYRVRDLVDEFVARLARRHGALEHRPARLLLSRAPADELDSGGTDVADLPGQVEAERLYHQMSLAGGAPRQPTKHRAYPSASADTERGAALTATSAQSRRDTPSIVIDCVMNSEDTLDSFISPGLDYHHHQQLLSQGYGSSFDVVVDVWERVGAQPPAPHPTVLASGAETQRTLAKSNDDRRDGLALVLAAGSQSGGVVGPSPPLSLPMSLRSTYVDLLAHRRRHGERRDTERAGFSVLDGIESTGSDDDRCDEWGAARSNIANSGLALATRRTKRAGAAVQQRYEERVALEQCERDARGTVVFTEESERRLVVGLHDDSMRHLLTVAALQGNVGETSQLGTLLRKHQVYPCDTLPLANVATAEEKRRLAVNADNTALLSFQFLDAAPKRKKTDQEARREQMRAKYLLPGDSLSSATDKNGHRKSYRELMKDAVEHERRLQERELREEMRREYFLERGEPLPPREPTPPPSPTTPRLEDIPSVVLLPFMESYSDERHAIIRDERRIFRDMTTAMRGILVKQQRADEKAVALAYREELQAAEDFFRFNFDAFNAVGPA